jgi:hypothetical protein
MSQIWYNDIKHLFTKENYLHFFPKPEMSTKEQLNAIFRLSIYFTALMILLTGNYKYMYIIIIVGLITFGMNVISNTKIDKKSEDNLKIVNRKNTDSQCTIPTKQNPFMNLLISEIEENPNKAQSCNIENDDIKKSVRKNFNDGLLRSESDIFQKNASDRQFYKMPNTEIINKQGEFGQWLYGGAKSCKENTINCKGSTYRNIY